MGARWSGIDLFFKGAVLLGQSPCSVQACGNHDNKDILPVSILV